MLSKIFRQYNRTLSILTVAFLLATIGCGSKTVDLATSQDHPANPNAQQGASTDHHNMLMAEMHKADMPMGEMHEKTERQRSTELSVPMGQKH